MGQLTGAVKQDTANNPLANMNYFYDLIGNRTSATENSATTTYTKLYPNGIRNQAEAQRVLMVITKECKFTKIFNQKAKKGPKAVAAWFDQYGYKYVPVELQEKAIINGAILNNKWCHSINGINGAILYISMTGNLLHINYSLWVFLFDKLDYR